jgi:predicted esterase
MQVQVPNLRLLSERNNGIFPEESITEYIDGRTVVSSHGDRRMPVWGDVFRWTDEDDPEAEQLVQQRIAAVVDFIREMQY